MIFFPVKLFLVSELQLSPFPECFCIQMLLLSKQGQKKGISEKELRMVGEGEWPVDKSERTVRFCERACACNVRKMVLRR